MDDNLYRQSPCTVLFSRLKPVWGVAAMSHIETLFVKQKWVLEQHYQVSLITGTKMVLHHQVPVPMYTKY